MTKGFVELNSDQRREVVNTQQRFQTWQNAFARQKASRGSMVKREFERSRDEAESAWKAIQAVMIRQSAVNRARPGRAPLEPRDAQSGLLAP